MYPTSPGCRILSDFRPTKTLEDIIRDVIDDQTVRLQAVRDSKERALANL